jgi:hypothetical protein
MIGTYDTGFPKREVWFKDIYSTITDIYLYKVKL